MLPIMFNDKWFPTLFDDLFTNNIQTSTVKTPATNIKEYSDKYIVDIAAPGINKEFCKVSVNDEGNLTIAIENKQEHKNEDKQHKYLRKEFSYFSYKKDYTLTDDVDKDNITAKVEDGILSVTLPKITPRQKTTKIIEIK